MLSNNYKIYVSSIIKLTRSLVIKSQHNIEAINNFLSLAGHTLPTNEKDWKYYRNVSGEYYVGDTGFNDDVLMTIISLDTQEVINFDKVSLASHGITFTEYKSKGSYYDILTALYPDQVELIDGILFPVNIDSAIAAKDFTILHYDTSLVASNEVSLIPKVQKWLYSTAIRWDIKSYTAGDNLYAAGLIGIFTLDMVMTIINIRLELCKTNEVSEYHLWNYLGGYFRLDAYKDRIPKGQALFLYRNIEYIVAHAGEDDVLNFLNDNFARPYGLSLFSFYINQNSLDKLTKLDSMDLHNLKNNLEFNRSIYGSTADTGSTVDTTTVVDLLEDYAIENKNNRLNDIANLDTIVNRDSTVSLSSGLIECNVRRNHTDVVIKEYSELIHTWFYTALNDRYPFKINLIVPELNITGILLSAKDSVAVMLYAAAKFQGNVLVNIPTHINVRDILHIPVESESTLRGLVLSKYLAGTNYHGNTSTTWDKYIDIMDGVSDVGIISNVLELEERVDVVINKKVRNSLLLGTVTITQAKGQLNSLINKTYLSGDYPVSDYTTYEELFTALGSDLGGYSNYDMFYLIEAVMLGMTNFKASNGKLPSPYQEMMEIINILTSYTTQLVGGNSGDILEPLDWVFNDTVEPGWDTIDRLTLIDFGLKMDNNLSFATDSGEFFDLYETKHLELLSVTQTDYNISEGLDIEPEVKTSDFLLLDNSSSTFFAEID